jgi:hypothetical protein
MKQVFYSALTILALAACGTSAYIEKSWRDPEVTVDLAKLNKVLVVALLKNDTYRHTVEDQLVSMLGGKGVASYNYLTKDIKEGQESELESRVKGEGFDGAIVMKLADVQKEVNYVPATYSTYPRYYGRFWSYYWNSWNSFYQPGYYENTKIYTVVTNVYSFKRDKLIWSGVSKSADPENVDKLMNAVAKEVFKKMREEGFVTNA